MQKINFLPQVKLWNAVEFNARHVWQNPSLGEMTYDGSSNSNRFAVAVQGAESPHWEYILTSQSSNEYAATVLRVFQNGANYVDISTGSNGIITVYTESLYNPTSNKIATMADVQGAVAGASLLGIKMDSSILHIDDSSYVMMYSDPSNLYHDEGGSSGSNNFNPLATVGTVEAAIQNALSGLGDVFEIKGIYNSSTGGTVNGNNIPANINDFGLLLNELSQTPSGLSGMSKGSVIVFNNEEYVLLNDSNPGNLLSWEVLGSVSMQTCVVSLGGQSGTLNISDSFSMTGTGNKTLTLNPASTTNLGGVKTGHSESAIDSSTKYNFALNIGSSGNDTNKGYVTIPIITGANTDASYGILASSTLQKSTRIYTVTINPETCLNLGISYSSIRSIRMIHNLGSDSISVNVYKIKSATGQSQINGKQLVYVDEIVAGPNILYVDFGSSEAFIGCQDIQNNQYLGYVIVIAASSITTSLDGIQMSGNVDPNSVFTA